MKHKKIIIGLLITIITIIALTILFLTPGPNHLTADPTTPIDSITPNIKVTLLVQLEFQPENRTVSSIVINNNNFTVYNITYIEPYTEMVNGERVRLVRTYNILQELGAGETFYTDLPTVYSYAEPTAYGWKRNS